MDSTLPSSSTGGEFSNPGLPAPLASPVANNGPDDTATRMARMAVEIDTLRKRLDELAATPRAQIQQLEELDGKMRQMQTRLRQVNTKRIFDAQITGYNASGTKYAWKEMYATSAGLSTFTGGLVVSATNADGSAIERNGWRYVPSGTNVLMEAYQNVNCLKFVFTNPVPPPANSAINFNQGLAYSSASKAMAWIGDYVCSG